MRQRVRDAAPRSRGFILMAFYLFLVVLLTQAVGLLAYTVSEMRTAERSQADIRALYLAEAGVDRAVVQLRSNGNWNGGNGSVGLFGNYVVGLRALAGNRREVTAQGNASFRGANENRSVQTIVQLAPNPLFRYALFADGKMKMNGRSTTDSYNSSQGAYRPATAGEGGGIGTNAVAKGKVRLGGHATVRGNATVGPGGNPSQVIRLKRDARISGSSSAASEPYPSTPVTIPGNLANRGNLRISRDQSVTLPGGTYWYENIHVSGNGRLSFTGPAVVYISDKLKVGGDGVVTSGDLPTQLVIYVGGEQQISEHPRADDKVDLGGDAQIYAGIFAPAARVKVNGRSSLYGAIVGRDVKVNLKEYPNGGGGPEGDGDDEEDGGSAGIHYDRAFLNQDGSPGNQVRTLSWTETP